MENIKFNLPIKIKVNFYKVPKYIIKYALEKLGYTQSQREEQSNIYTKNDKKIFFNIDIGMISYSTFNEKNKYPFVSVSKKEIEKELKSESNKILKQIILEIIYYVSSLTLFFVNIKQENNVIIFKNHNFTITIKISNKSIIIQNIENTFLQKDINENCINSFIKYIRSLTGQKILIYENSKIIF